MLSENQQARALARTLSNVGSAPSPLWTSVFSSVHWGSWTKAVVFTHTRSSCV